MDGKIESDPATDVYEICKAVANQFSGQDIEYAQLVANAFGVKVWSKDFYQLILEIQSEFGTLFSVLESIQIDEDVHLAAEQSIRRLEHCFKEPGLRHKMSKSNQISPNNFLSPEALLPLRLLSPAMRPIAKTYRLTPIAQEELLGKWKL
ncbi:MAG: hypothetical protein AAF253_07710 [Pseudomonadota bacterium]